MGLASRFLRIPKPQKFLYALSLSTGASLITLSLLLNKLSGVYGILALLTGFHLSPFQLSMYIYSILALVLTIYLTPYIKTQSPLYCLALAWFYVLDSIVNAAYTGVFGVTWFLVLMSHKAGEATNKGPGAGTVGDTAGFTDPAHNVSSVEVVATPADGILAGGQDAVAGTVPSDSPAGTGPTAIVWGRESINSTGIIITLWTIRAYFCLVMLSWARMVLRQHIAAMAARNPITDFGTASKEATMTENPFDETKPEGQGWQGKLGRFMISLGRNYWLGTDNDDSWMLSMGGKFENSHQQSRRERNMGSTGSANGAFALAKINSERENRRRSGTGPPLPSVSKAAGIVSDGEDGGESGNLLQVPQQ